MKIEELADIIQTDLIIRLYSGQHKRYCANFEYAEIKDGVCLVGVHGNATTPAGAIQEYIDRIKGKTLVVHADDRIKRIEINIPETLTR